MHQRVPENRIPVAQAISYGESQDETAATDESSQARALRKLLWASIDNDDSGTWTNSRSRQHTPTGR